MSKDTYTSDFVNSYVYDPKHVQQVISKNRYSHVMPSSVYCGESKDGVPHGFGRLNCESTNYINEGLFFNGCFIKGVTIFKNTSYKVVSEIFKDPPDPILEESLTVVEDIESFCEKFVDIFSKLSDEVKYNYYLSNESHKSFKVFIDSCNRQSKHYPSPLRKYIIMITSLVETPTSLSLSRLSNNSSFQLLDSHIKFVSNVLKRLSPFLVDEGCQPINKIMLRNRCLAPDFIKILNRLNLRYILGPVNYGEILYISGYVPQMFFFKELFKFDPDCDKHDFTIEYTVTNSVDE